MAEYDFVRFAGVERWSSQEEVTDGHASTALVDAVCELGVEVDRLRVSFRDGVVTVAGAALNRGDQERVILAIGNTRGVARVYDVMSTISPGPPAAFYIVRSYDTLPSIAADKLGASERAYELLHANQPLVRSPSDIAPGQTIRIPLL